MNDTVGDATSELRSKVVTLENEIIVERYAKHFFEANGEARRGLSA